MLENGYQFGFNAVLGAASAIFFLVSIGFFLYIVYILLKYGLLVSVAILEIIYASIKGYFTNRKLDFTDGKLKQFFRENPNAYEEIKAAYYETDHYKEKNSSIYKDCLTWREKYDKHNKIVAEKTGYPVEWVQPVMSSAGEYSRKKKNIKNWWQLWK